MFRLLKIFLQLQPYILSIRIGWPMKSSTNSYCVGCVNRVKWAGAPSI